MTIRGVNRLNHISYKDKIMNQSSDLVDEIISDGESCRTENPRLITNKPLYRCLRAFHLDNVVYMTTRL